MIRVLDVWLDKQPYSKDKIKGLQDQLCEKVGLSKEEVYK